VDKKQGALAKQINKSAIHSMQFDTHIWHILYFTANNPYLQGQQAEQEWNKGQWKLNCDEETETG
jgi:hypothetical protein